MASFEPTTIIWKDSSGETFFLTFDAVTGDTVGLAAQITQHPVELDSIGSTGTLTDHTVLEPIKHNLNGIISASPCFIPADSFNGGATGFTKKVEVKGAKRDIGDAVSKVPLIARGIPGVPAGIPIGGALLTRIQVGYDKATINFPDVSQERRPVLVANALRRIRDERRIVTIRGKLFTLENMMLANCDIDRPKFGGRITVASVWQQVQVTTVETVEAPLIPTKAKAQGQKPVKPAEEEPQQAESFLSRSVSGIKSFLGGK